ncbi:OBAP family protein [Proteobacteria bacterium 005FR1]|nr:OBAP family protein [Proteobacteria bacterium 005FR1]
MSKDRKIGINPAGEGKPWKASLLESGADFLQSNAPVQQFDIYMAGFHCARHDPDMQMEAHHYCHQVNGEFLQCILFDGNTRDANLIGIEYIISERLFASLPAEEQSRWHPHNYEVFSGELVAPGLPRSAEKAMLSFLVNSYGKTWHTWKTCEHNDPSRGNSLPLGEPQLMWSFNRFGELDEAMKKGRNQALGVNEDKKRKERESLADDAHPQRGVDTLKHAFPGADGRPGGVADLDDGEQTD